MQGAEANVTLVDATVSKDSTNLADKSIPSAGFLKVEIVRVADRLAEQWHKQPARSCRCALHTPPLPLLS